MSQNIKVKPGFTQVCVWPATLVEDDQLAGFVEFFQEEFSTRIQYLETILTAPDIENGKPVEGTGGRADVIFAVHDDDVSKFAVPRLNLGIRWIEDVLAPCNNTAHLYPARVTEYISWDVGIEC